MELTDNKIIAAFVAAFVAMAGWLLKHLTSSSKHPCKADLVYSDVCEERGKSNEKEHQRLEDCIEGAIERSNEQHAELKQDIGTMSAKLDRLLEK